jgi:hypothetical protein
MIGTQSRRPCRAVQLGETVLLNNPVSPMLNALLNSQNNRRALSRGEGNIIDFAVSENQRF